MEERRESDKEGKILESLNDNGGIRTVMQGSIKPKGAAPSHFHDRYEETLEIVEGELSVWLGKKKIILKEGQSFTVPRNTVHRFKNETKSTIIMNVIIEPGSIGWENTVKVSQGLIRDNLAEKVSKFTYSNIPYYTFMLKQTNTLPVGVPKIIFSVLNRIHGKKKLDQYEKDVLEKYCL